MFTSARIKLTVWYLFIILSVSASFSLAIYGIWSHEVGRFARVQRTRIERGLDGNLPLPPAPIRNAPDLELLEEARLRFGVTLVLINVIILVVSGGLGYLLAGKTLKPIKLMIDEQNRFVTDASHELRTPLTALKSTMEVFLRSKTPTIKGSKDLIRSSIEEVNKLKVLSDSLLSLSQYQEYNNSVRFEQVSLKKVVREAVDKIAPLAGQRDISINEQVKDMAVRGNKYSLVDLFVILLENAIKYSPDESKVAIVSSVSGRAINVSVKDEGSGIEEKDIPRIFDRFYRADKSRSSSGFGLGLSIAKRIVDMHKGKIFVESRVGKGSTFTVIFQI